MYSVHFSIHLLDFVYEPLAVVGIINELMVFLGPLLLLQSFQVAVPAVPVHVPLRGQIVNH